MPSHVITMLLVDLVLVLVAARVLGQLAVRVGQPPVVGEIAAGILAGPTVLGTHLSTTLFPMETRPALTALANVGIALFMFVAGMETDLGRFGRNRSAVPVVALSAYLVPFVLGSAVALTVLARHQTGSRIGFVLYIGCSLAVTAFPVLARILHDRNMFGTPVGQLALGCAAVGDVLAWVVLAAVVATTRTGPGHTWRLLLLVPLAAGTWWIVRPILGRVLGAATERTVTLVAVCGALLWGAATEWAGLHLIFGAFLLGVVFPRGSREQVAAAVQPLGALFMPCFFVIAGLRVDLSSTDRAGVLELLVVVAAAVAGKLGGTYLSARLARIEKHTAQVLAALLNTRGLTELILLDVGLSTGIIGADLYSLLVVMALFTTALTAPLLSLLRVGSKHAAGEEHSRHEDEAIERDDDRVAPGTGRPGEEPTR
ncbi:cation:proton antiporter [Nocardia blacklockiae]|uniref:cation:proton antiporter n=1 Tax=Nocardia blacklockiae TaxID=480036 RepID=UPI001895E688|nr:cation:proton antiporter [Nocardia blacklockiae]MBF6176320.1 cation:proton antiporter [Nocardia blacklockiae]